MLAVLALQRHSAPPIMHSRSLNPYVASAFEEWTGQQHVNPLVPKVGSLAWLLCAQHPSTLLARTPTRVPTPGPCRLPQRGQPRPGCWRGAAALA